MSQSARTQRAASARQCPPGCTDQRVTERLIAASADLALVLDGDDVIREVTFGDGAQTNPQWKKLLGRRWVDTISEDSQAKVGTLLTEARAGSVTRPREINQQGEGIGEVMFRFSAVLLDGKKKVVVLGRDLSPMAALQQQMISSQQAMDREFSRMRQAETRYRLLFQVASEGVVVVVMAVVAMAAMAAVR